MGRAEPLEVWWTRLRLRAVQALGRPVTAIEAVVILAVVGAIAFAVMRSGNEAVMAPSGAELKFRSLLESLLGWPVFRIHDWYQQKPGTFPNDTSGDIGKAAIITNVYAYRAVRSVGGVLSSGGVTIDKERDGYGFGLAGDDIAFRSNQ